MPLFKNWTLLMSLRFFCSINFVLSSLYFSVSCRYVGLKGSTSDFFFVWFDSWFAQHIKFLFIEFTFHIEFIHPFYNSWNKQKAGNEAFQSRKYTDAIEYYTIALSSNVESRPFAAICLCNRAAAYQALGQTADAIADCSLAIALDGNYAKVCFCIHMSWHLANVWLTFVLSTYFYDLLVSLTST